MDSTSESTILAALNSILASIGQAPVTTIERTNPDVAICYDTLMQVSREVQAEGWTFNKEFHYNGFPRNTSDEILIPSNVLQIKLSDNFRNRDYDAIQREGKLYDRVNHTYKWTFDPEVDVVWLLDFEDIPAPIRDYIVAKSATTACYRLIGDTDQYKVLMQKEMMDRSTALEYDCNQGNFSFFGMQQGSNYYVSYQPFRALQR